MTLAHVSVTQYMSYSTARRLSLGDKSQIDQAQSAKRYYQRLRGQFFKSSAHAGQQGQWFLINPRLEPLDQRTGYLKGYVDSHFMGGGPNDSEGMFYGAGLSFESRILNFSIPFLIKDSCSIFFNRLNSRPLRKSKLKLSSLSILK